MPVFGIDGLNIKMGSPKFRSNCEILGAILTLEYPVYREEELFYDVLGFLSPPCPGLQLIR